LFSLIGPIRKKADIFIFSFVPTTDRNNIKIWQISNRTIFSSDISRWERGKKKKRRAVFVRERLRLAISDKQHTHIERVGRELHSRRIHTQTRGGGGTGAEEEEESDKCYR
jgi:hypothetical protein